PPSNTSSSILFIKRVLNLISLASFTLNRVWNNPEVATSLFHVIASGITSTKKFERYSLKAPSLYSKSSDCPAVKRTLTLSPIFVPALMEYDLLMGKSTTSGLQLWSVMALFVGMLFL